MSYQIVRTAANTAITDHVFAAPTPKMKRPPPKVLDEDNYTAVLEHLVERDFFPDLARLKKHARRAEGRLTGHHSSMPTGGPAFPPTSSHGCAKLFISV